MWDPPRNLYICLSMLAFPPTTSFLDPMFNMLTYVTKTTFE